MNFNIFDSSIGTIISLCNLFTYCFFGKLATESFESMADCVFETNWPEFPIEQQKNVILLISNMQKSLYYHGFEVAILRLETFTKVSFPKGSLFVLHYIQNIYFEMNSKYSLLIAYAMINIYLFSITVLLNVCCMCWFTSQLNYFNRFFGRNKHIIFCAKALNSYK